MGSKEFKMRFAYNSHYYWARVLTHFSDDRMTYAVRPSSLTLAKGYGQQTLITRKDNDFSCEGNLNKTNPGYITALINALKSVLE